MLSTDDLLIGPVGYDFPGRRVELFRDRFVCVVDPAVTGLAEGSVLTLDDLARMPHAAPTFAPGLAHPGGPGARRARRHAAGAGDRLRLAVGAVRARRAPSMVAIMPERMARLAIRSAQLAILEPPFGLVELVEAAYWHPSRTDDPAVRWLLRALREAAREL